MRSHWLRDGDGERCGGDAGDAGGAEGGDADDSDADGECAFDERDSTART